MWRSVPLLFARTPPRSGASATSPSTSRSSREIAMPAIRYPTRYRPLPHGPDTAAKFHAQCVVLLDQATEVDNAQRALSVKLGEIRTQLAELRVVMWPRVDPKDIVHGFRRVRRGGPPPIPPVAPTAHPLHGKHLRSTALAILARNARPMTLVEIHRELHLNGYAIASRHPVKRLGDALGYENTKGRAKRLDRGLYIVDELNPGTRRRLARMRMNPALQTPDDLGHQLSGGGGIGGNPHAGGLERFHLRLGRALGTGDDGARVTHLL